MALIRPGYKNGDVQDLLSQHGITGYAIAALPFTDIIYFIHPHTHQTEILLWQDNSTSNSAQKIVDAVLFYINTSYLGEWEQEIEENGQPNPD